MTELLVTGITLTTACYGILATCVFAHRRPTVGQDPSTGRYRATRQIWRERQH